MIRRLVAKHKTWSRAERERLAGQEVELTGEVDRLGQHEAVVLTGPLAGRYLWLRADEMVEVRE